MPADKQGGQGTQKSGEQNKDTDANQKVPQKGQQGQQRQQGGQGQQEESENERMPGGGKGNR